MSAESAGAAAATPVAAPAEPSAAEAAARPLSVRCANCGAPVSGRYCGACGQRLEPPLHTLSHFIRVATEDLTHADSRIWRTLAALMFRPGFLTAEFIGGRRASYLPPVRLYLVLSVVFFLWLDTTHSMRVAAQPRAATGGPAPAAATANPDKKVYTPFSPPRPGETEEQRTARLCRGWSYEGPWQERIRPLMSSACPRIVADRGRALGEAYLHNVPRAMFLFLPLLAGAMRLMYWRPRHYYVEHLLLLVHNHAFVFLIVLIAWPLSALLPVGGTWLRTAAVLYIPWYMYRSMRVVYGQGRAPTLGKLAVLSFFYLVSGAIMLCITVVYSALTL